MIFQQKWRKENKENFTTAESIFPVSKVIVGKMSYGPLNIYSWGSIEEKLVIGNYVSIASNVKFLLGGNHRIDTITTYPFKVKVLGEEIEATTKGEINIEDDVWIGTDAMILSGVTLSKGSVVAARSVVTKSVPPYAVVGGNPAKIIKYRFSEDTIKELKHVDINKFSKTFITENIDILYEKVNQETQQEILKRFSK